MSVNAIQSVNQAKHLRWVMLLHFVLCSVGLIKLAMLSMGEVYDAKLLSFAISKLGNRALDIGWTKLAAFLQYFLGAALLVVWYGLVALLLTASVEIRQPRLFSHKWVLGLYFLLNIYITLRIYNSAHSFMSWAPFWLFFAAALPLMYFAPALKKLPALPRRLGWGLLAIVFLQMWLIFQPMIFHPMLIENDFMELPGETQLASGEWVDNIRYTNQHDIGGILKYDPRTDNGETPLPRDETFVPIQWTHSLQNFFSANINNAKFHFIYYPHLGVLSVVGTMTDKEHWVLRYSFADMKAVAQVDKLYLMSLKRTADYMKRVYTPEEADFIQKNKIEILDQARTGWFFYHHNYFFGPIFALAQGANPETQNIVYGWFTTLFFAKLLPYLGGVNYQSYFKLLFSVYPLYFLGFLATLFVIFRRVEYALLGMMLCVASLFLLGIELIRLAPGFNPIRHFLDIFVLLSFYLFIQRKQLLWLIFSFVLTIVSLLLNKDFGMFLMLSLSATIFIKAFVEKKIVSAPTIVTLIFGVLSLFVYTHAVPGKNPEFIYMLLGIGSPPTTSFAVKTLLLFVAAMCFLAVLFRQVKSSVNYFWLAVIFYCQLLLIYFIWYPMVHHVYGMAVPFILLVLSVVYLAIRYFQVEKYESQVLFGLVVSFLVLVYAPSALNFYDSSHKYHANFKHHRLYEWSFDTAQVVSTINPQLLNNAATLVKQYATAPGIYIISKYDDVIPVLAGKYTEMRFPELLTNLVTSNTTHNVVQLIKEKKPMYLFVDTDIARSHNTEIYNDKDAFSRSLVLHDYSFDRVASIEKLKEVYLGVIEDYKPIAKSELITVYKRKDA